MSKKTYALVVNLKSRQASLLLEEVKSVFADKPCKLKVIAVEDPKHINKSFQKAIDLDPDVIVLGGGDGTLISGIEYLSKKDYRKEIGLLPLGTANYLARDLSIPLDVPGAIATLLRGKSREIPIGVANGKYFALTFMLGLTQAVSEQVSDTLKRKLGQLAYVIELFKQTKQHDAFAYKIESNDLKEPLRGTTHQMVIYNANLNQQLKVVPHHELEKPTLKVVVSHCGHSKFKFYLGFIVHILTFGRMRTYMHVFEARSLKITTDPIIRADYDGESWGESPFEVAICKQKIRVIC